MPLRDVIEALVRAAPSDATIPVRWLAEQLAEDDAAPEANAKDGVDLTVPEVAKRFGRSAAAVRQWCASGRLPGAYRLHGREWRVPWEALGAMQRSEAARCGAAARQALHVRGDTSAWRQHLPCDRLSA